MVNNTSLSPGRQHIVVKDEGCCVRLALVLHVSPNYVPVLTYWPPSSVFSSVTWTQLLYHGVVHEDWTRSYVTLRELLAQLPLLPLFPGEGQGARRTWSILWERRSGRGTAVSNFQPGGTPRRVKLIKSYGPGETAAERTSVLGTLAIKHLKIQLTSAERTGKENDRVAKVVWFSAF